MVVADTAARSYQVLYYKRKNKVHKAKGVSKCDGRLTVVPAPSCMVTLVDGEDGKNKVYTGIQREVAKSAFGDCPLQEDDTVIVGQYECQITQVNKNDDENNENVSTRKSATGTIQKCLPKPLLSKHAQYKKPLPFTKRPSATAVKPFASRQSLKPTSSKSTSTSTSSAIPSWQVHRLPPAQPKRKAVDDDDDDETKQETETMNIMATTTTTKPNPLYKKRKVTTVARAAATSTTSQGPSQSTHFPGAIGTVTVPPSILKVLRPHQTQGVAFLWNCLTAVSPDLQQAAMDAGAVSSYSSSAAGRSTTAAKMAGAICADEMGLGKTLMTIATIFAMYRKQKEKRFIVVCPSSLVSNWGKEFDKWIGKASQPKRVVVRRGGETGLQMIRAFVPVKPHQSEVLIISYDLFRMNASLLNQAKQIGLLVVDEGHRLKNSAGSLTLTALKGLQCDARLLITGTILFAR